jgi:acetolactate synthase-1/2/3 large subunit
MMGLSLYPTKHPLYFGMLGMHGVKSANEAVSMCDTMILIGARVGDRSVRAPQFLAETTKIIHIDIDPAEIGKNIPVDIPLVGDCKNILGELTALMPEGSYPEWVGKLSEIKNITPVTVSYDSQPTDTYHAFSYAIFDEYLRNGSTWSEAQAAYNKKRYY